MASQGYYSIEIYNNTIKKEGLYPSQKKVTYTYHTNLRLF